MSGVSLGSAVLIVLSLLWPASLSASLPLRGGVLFSELSEAEPESAYIRSLLTSDAEEGLGGDENEATKGLIAMIPIYTLEQAHWIGAIEREGVTFGTCQNINKYNFIYSKVLSRLRRQVV